MILSFFTLAITGMILKFSYMGWAQVSASLLGGFAVSGTLHRMAALALITIWLIHVADVVKKKRASGLSWFRFIMDKRNSLMFTRPGPSGFPGIGSVVPWEGPDGRPTAAGPTGRSSTTSRCSGECSSSGPPESSSGSRNSSPGSSR